MVNTGEYTKETLDELMFTVNELEEIKSARKKPIVFDEDCPEVTPEKALKYKRVNPPRNINIQRV